VYLLFNDIYHVVIVHVLWIDNLMFSTREREGERERERERERETSIISFV